MQTGGEATTPVVVHDVCVDGPIDATNAADDTGAAHEADAVIGR
jgi:hypothetical protein